MAKWRIADTPVHIIDKIKKLYKIKK